MTAVTALQLQEDETKEQVEAVAAVGSGFELENILLCTAAYSILK